ncbi:MAG: hypothetical protein WC712_13475 [Candidatus Brocadiia bacterium]
MKYVLFALVIASGLLLSGCTFPDNQHHSSGWGHRDRSGSDYRRDGRDDRRYTHGDDRRDDRSDDHRDDGHSPPYRHSNHTR